MPVPPRKNLTALDHSAARNAAALLGSIPASLAIGSALAVALPLSDDERLLIGGYAVFPLWLLLACLSFLASSGRRAWLHLLAAFALAAVVVVVGNAVRT